MTKAAIHFILVISIGFPFVLCAQDSFRASSASEVPDTFVHKVEDAGTFAASNRNVNDGYVTVNTIATSPGTITTVLVRKISVAGVKVWETTLNFAITGISPQVFIHSVAQTSDGGYVLGGSMGCPLDQANCPAGDFGRALFVKLHPNGSIAWSKALTPSGKGGYFLTSVFASGDGGAIAIGAVRVYNSRRFQLEVTKLATDGTLLSNNAFDPQTNAQFNLTAVQTRDGGILISYPVAQPARTALVRMNSSLQIEWQKAIVSADDTYSALGSNSVDGAVLVSISDPRSLKLVVLKSDGDKDVTKQHSFVFPGRFGSVETPVQTPDGGYLIAGTQLSGTSSAGFLIKTDFAGNVVFHNVFDGSTTSADSVYSGSKNDFFLFGNDTSDQSLLILRSSTDGLVANCGFVGSLPLPKAIRFGGFKIKLETSLTSAPAISFQPFSQFGLSPSEPDKEETVVCD